MNLFAMFAKYWEPGRVKTRLAADIGVEQAAGIYQQFVETLLSRFASVGDTRQLIYSPPKRQREMEQAAGRHWQPVPQAEGDLGQRMHHFFQQAFTADAQRVVLIGSDSPLLPRELVDQAFAQLADHELVLGPSYDGGYYLVGASRQTPPIFEGIAWSTPAVLEQTLAAAGAAGVHAKLLPNWYDVDDLNDLRQLCDRLRESGDHPALSAAVDAAVRSSRNDFPPCNNTTV